MPHRRVNKTSEISLKSLLSTQKKPMRTRRNEAGTAPSRGLSAHLRSKTWKAQSRMPLRLRLARIRFTSFSLISLPSHMTMMNEPMSG